MTFNVDLQFFVIFKLPGSVNSPTDFSCLLNNSSNNKKISSGAEVLAEKWEKKSEKLPINLGLCFKLRIVSSEPFAFLPSTSEDRTKSSKSDSAAGANIFQKNLPVFFHSFF